MQEAGDVLGSIGEGIGSAFTGLTQGIGSLFGSGSGGLDDFSNTGVTGGLTDISGSGAGGIDMFGSAADFLNGLNLGGFNAAGTGIGGGLGGSFDPGSIGGIGIDQGLGGVGTGGWGDLLSGGGSGGSSSNSGSLTSASSGGATGDGTGTGAAAGAAGGMLGGLGKYLPMLLGLGLPAALQLLGGKNTIPEEGNLKKLANQAQGVGKLANTLQTGKLPPGAEQMVVNSTNDAKTAIRSKYAAMGMSGSTQETQDLAGADERAAALRFQIADQVTQTGLNALGLADSFYTQIAQLQLSQDQELQGALSSFAQAMMISSAYAKGIQNGGYGDATQA